MWRIVSSVAVYVSMTQVRGPFDSFVSPSVSESAYIAMAIPQSSGWPSLDSHCSSYDAVSSFPD